MSFRNYFRLLAEDRPYSTRLAWFWKPVLRVASWFYWVGLNLHRGFYQIGLLKRGELARPVVSVGNLTWGGTGKTPLVEHVAQFFLGQGKTPLILARGYGSDEAKELQRKIPNAEFGFGANRLSIGREVLAKKNADVVVLDDGFQHWSVKRKLDLVTVNALHPFGNSSLIPRGTLREPISALKRASVVVLVDVNLVSRKEVEALRGQIQAVAPQVKFVEAYHEPLHFYRGHSGDRIDLDRLKGKRVTSFSGIGTPRSFQLVLNRLGIKIVRNFEFSDHHVFGDRELNEILRMKHLSDSDEIITTEKDFLRCQDQISKIVKPLLLKVRLSVSVGHGELEDALNGLIRNTQNRHSRESRDPRLKNLGMTAASS